MLTPQEENYLATLPDNKMVHIFPYSSKLKEIADALIASVHSFHPELNCLFGGAAGLGISGQNDLDIDFLTVPAKFEEYIPTFIKLFGKPRVRNGPVAAWSFQIEGVEIDHWLTDETSEEVQNQHRIFHLLQSNSVLRKEYEDLKISFEGKPYREYQRAKYEFCNRVLASN